MPEVVESLLTIQAAVLPGTDARLLASRLADAVATLPVTAAAMVGPTEVPAYAANAARALGEKQGLAEAAADFQVYVARLWHEADEKLFPADRTELAANMRIHWEQRVSGVGSGLIGVTVFPVGLFIDSQQWLTLARRCPWAAVTANAPEGLIPTD